MTRSEVREFIKEGINLMNPPIEFNEGTVPDFAGQRTNEYPSSLLVLETVETSIAFSAPTDSWAIRLIIFKQDKLDSVAEVYEGMVDECDDIARKLIYKYRNIVEGYKLVSMTSVTRTKFIKGKEFGADCLTGIEINFTLTSPDTQNVCL